MSADPTDPLAQPCPKCGAPIGEHSLRDWLDHTNVGHHEVPFIAVSPEPGQSDGQLCDTLDTRAMIADSPLGRLGLVEMHWQIGVPIGLNRTVAKVVFAAPPIGLRAAGRLLRDSMNRAANVAEGKR